MNLDKPSFLNPAITNGRMMHYKNHRKWYFAELYLERGYKSMAHMIRDFYDNEQLQEMIDTPTHRFYGIAQEAIKLEKI